MNPSIDVAAATAFVATHGRILDRRRLDLLLGGGATTSADVLAALDAYGNPDGGYGWGIEPDLRSSESQPAGAMHAFEVFAEAAPATTARAVELCDWVGASSRPDGGLPFTLPMSDHAGNSPVWEGDDHTTSSLQTTAQVVANAHRVARHDPTVATHPWLARGTRWCLDAISAIDQAPSAHELLFAIRFLDVVGPVEPEAAPLLDRLGGFVPADGIVPVQGGADDEALRPLDLAPWPDGPARRLFPDDLVAGELRRLADGQEPDGGWTVDFESASPAATLEWRAYATVAAVGILRRYRAA
jgi:hypothetical protein